MCTNRTLWKIPLRCVIIGRELHKRPLGLDVVVTVNFLDSEAVHLIGDRKIKRVNILLLSLSYEECQTTPNLMIINFHESRH